MTESTLLIALGATLGVGLAQIALAMLRRLGAGVLPRLDEVHTDGTVLAVTRSSPPARRSCSRSSR